MRMTTHTIDVDFEELVPEPGVPESHQQVVYPEVRITYTYLPGAPAYTPRGEYAPIDPPEPPEIEVTSVELLDAKGLAPDAARVRAWGDAWMQDDRNFWFAVGNAMRERRMG